MKHQVDEIFEAIAGTLCAIVLSVYKNNEHSANQSVPARYTLAMALGFLLTNCKDPTNATWLDYIPLTSAHIFCCLNKEVKQKMGGTSIKCLNKSKYQFSSGK